MVPSSSGTPTQAILEEAERRQAAIHRGVRDEHVHRGAGERQQRAGVAGEDHRHQELRRRSGEAHRHHHDHRQEGRDRAVEVDERGQHRDQEHGQHQQSRLALARLPDQELAGPGGDAGGVETGTDHEQGGDEDHRGIAETGQRLAEIEHARGPERERRGERHDDDRQAVPDEQDHDRRHDGEGERDVTQPVRPPPASLPPKPLSGTASPCAYPIARFGGYSATPSGSGSARFGAG